LSGYFCSMKELLTSRDLYTQAYRAGAKQLHPDAGGSPVKWHTFQSAALVLQKHFGDKP
jgi:hypothetical protein